MMSKILKDVLLEQLKHIGKIILIAILAVAGLYLLFDWIIHLLGKIG